MTGEGEAISKHMKKHFEPTRTEAALLELLRGHIWQRPLEESYFEGLTADDWQSVYTLSCRQGVQGLACTAARTLPAALQPPAATLLPWIAGTRQIVAENQRKRQVWADLQELLRSHGLEPVLLKGFTISQYLIDSIPILASEQEKLEPTMMRLVTEEGPLKGAEGIFKRIKGDWWSSYLASQPWRLRS